MDSEHGASVSALTRYADMAMYVAKRNGSGYTRCHATDDPYSTARLTLIGELGDAVRGNQLEVYYPPRLDLCRVARLPALKRWCAGVTRCAARLCPAVHPAGRTHRCHSTAEVGDARSDADAIDGLGATGVRDDRRGESVRSPFDGRGVPHQKRRKLEKHRVDPVQLELEIAESAIIVDP